MIPITAGKTFNYKDVDGVYKFRYLTGDNQDKFIELSERLSKKGLSSKDSLSLSRGLIDLFLCGWEGKNFPEFPAEKPSAAFTIGDISKLAAVISENISELTQMSEGELKK